MRSSLLSTNLPLPIFCRNLIRKVDRKKFGKTRRHRTSHLIDAVTKKVVFKASSPEQYFVPVSEENGLFRKSKIGPEQLFAPHWDRHWCYTATNGGIQYLPLPLSSIDICTLASSTGSPQEVSHPRTVLAQCCLATVFEWELLYLKRQVILSKCRKTCVRNNLRWSKSFFTNEHLRKYLE